MSEYELTWIDASSSPLSCIFSDSRMADQAEAIEQTTSTRPNTVPSVSSVVRATPSSHALPSRGVSYDGEKGKGGGQGVHIPLVARGGVEKKKILPLPFQRTPLTHPRMVVQRLTVRAHGGGGRIDHASIAIILAL